MIVKTLQKITTSAFNIRSPFSQLLDKVKTSLRMIQFDDGKSLTQHNLISNIRQEPHDKVIIQVKLTQNFRKIKSFIQQNLKWVPHLQVKIAQQHQTNFHQKNKNLKNIDKILAVSSCKGGVGKSTIAVNLAFSLYKLGLKVGIFDADIYGPSLPTLIGKEKQILISRQQNPKQIEPIEFAGIKSMSFGYAAPQKRAVMRGPMVSSILSQLLLQTYWDQLDYLVVDMPPGTGDISITLSQEVQFDGSIIVTTPQRLSFIDVVKGIEMFEDLKVPVISVVQNMSYFVCRDCGVKNKIFGQGYMKMLKNQFGIKNSLQIPLLDKISLVSDSGVPIVLTLPQQHQVCQIFSQLASSIVNQLKTQKKQNPIVWFDTGTRKVIIEVKKQRKFINPKLLRIHCGCALCVDQMTGEKLMMDQDADQHVFPTKIEPKGNYAVAIIWSDGHNSSIYPYQKLLGQIPGTQ